MAIKIEKKIVKCSVVGALDKPASSSSSATEEVMTAEAPLPLNVAKLREQADRPQVLSGATYKIHTPLSEHAIYVTINDIELNGQRRPFEIFINSRNMDHFQWIVALTRVISSVFRRGGDATFLVEELRSVFDPKGGYFKKGGRYMPSLVAELGDVIEEHLCAIGLMPNDRHAAKLCPKCNTRALILVEGCPTCLSCGESKCG